MNAKVAQCYDSFRKAYITDPMKLLLAQTAGCVNINFIYSRKKECLIEAGGINKIIFLLERPTLII